MLQSASADMSATTRTITPAFGSCDPSQKYVDLSAAFGLGLVALAAVWAAKSFTLKLLQNQ